MQNLILENKIERATWKCTKKNMNNRKIKNENSEQLKNIILF